MPERLDVLPRAARGSIVDRLRATLRGRNALLNIFELWVGLAGVVAGVVFFYSPASIDQNSVALTIGRTAASVWVVGYLLAGLMIWYGLLRPSPKWEVAALWLLGGATAMNGFAIFDVFGVRGVASAATLLALTVAAWTRALVVQTVVIGLARQYQRENGHSDGG